VRLDSLRLQLRRARYLVSVSVVGLLPVRSARSAADQAEPPGSKHRCPAAEPAQATTVGPELDYTRKHGKYIAKAALSGPGRSAESCARRGQPAHPGAGLVVVGRVQGHAYASFPASENLLRDVTCRHRRASRGRRRHSRGCVLVWAVGVWTSPTSPGSALAEPYRRGSAGLGRFLAPHVDRTPAAACGQLATSRAQTAVASGQSHFPAWRLLAPWSRLARVGA